MEVDTWSVGCSCGWHAACATYSGALVLADHHYTEAPCPPVHEVEVYLGSVR